MASSPRKTLIKLVLGLPKKVRIAQPQPLKWPIFCLRLNPILTTSLILISRTTILMTSEGVSTPAAASGRRRARPRSARRRARELALQGVYAWLLRGDDGLADAGEIDAH